MCVIMSSNVTLFDSRKCTECGTSSISRASVFSGSVCVAVLCVFAASVCNSVNKRGVCLLCCVCSVVHCEHQLKQKLSLCI